MRISRYLATLAAAGGLTLGLSLAAGPASATIASSTTPPTITGSVLLAHSGPQGVPLPNSKTAVTTTQRINTLVQATLNPVTHSLTVTALPGHIVTTSNGSVVSSQVLPAPKVSPFTVQLSPTGESYSCIYSSSNSNFRAYPVYYAIGSGTGYYIQYAYYYYSVDNARILYGEGETLQVEQCENGGGTTSGGWKQYTDGSGQALEVTYPHLIGFKWPVSSTPTGVTASLGFQVGAGPVKITGSDSVTPQDTFQGSTGPDANAPALASFGANEVNAEWHSSSFSIFNGTAAYEGNVGHALWEGPEYPPYSIQIEGQAYLQRFCGYPFGLGCS
jgi:hypothetical protein